MAGMTHAALFLGLLCTVGADQGELPLSLLARHELLCPICEEPFTTIVCRQSNTRGGVDRDLFSRAVGPQPVFYHISTCPRCGYSGYASDFEPGIQIAPDVREKIRTEPGLTLPEGFTADSDPRELDARDRYALAIQCYEWRHASDEAVGWLHLRASWVEREEGSGVPSTPRLKRVMEYIERWRPPLPPEGNQADVELQLTGRIAEQIAWGRFNRFQKPYLELVFALLLRRHGENRQAAPMLEKLARETHWPEPVREAIDRMRASIDRERKHQLRAAEHFERALRARLPKPENQAPGCYLLAELFRRLGQDARAADWYARALNDNQLSLHLRNWATQQREWCLYQEPARRRN
jgi:hypothetical protein